MRQSLVAGNWKMNGASESIRKLVAEILTGLDTRAEVLLLPPALYVQQVRDQIKGTCVKLGVQNTSDKLAGAYTGEISPLMAKDMGCEYVLIGHSERRNIFSEKNKEIAAKFHTLMSHELTPVLCVGETLKERESNMTMEVITKQINTALLTLRPELDANFVIAYEPVWAIGTGLTATPEQAQNVHAEIRTLLANFNQTIAEQTRILYGGSMKATNASALMAQPDVDGGLVGGASLIPQDFKAICHATGY